MPTIKDVARACGLSAATVSYVLNDSRPVRPQTREKVLGVVRSMNYHPSAVARGLTRKRMDTLGIVFPNTGESPVLDGYYGPVLDGILSVAAAARKNATLFTGEIWADPQESLPVYRDGRCDGLMLIGPRRGDRVVEGLLAAGVPFIVVSSLTDDPRLCRVDVDNVAGARAVTEHLIGLGHRRIAVLSQDPASGTFIEQRLRGWREAIADAGLPPCEDLVRYLEFGAEETGAALRALRELPANERPTALFCTRDRPARFVLEVCAAHGVRVPEDLSLVGFDDIALAASAQPPLTTVRQPLNEIGRAAAELLLRCIEGRAEAGEAVILPAELIVRESTTAPAR